MSTLKSLFSSAVRADVLSLLLNSPDEKFYVREIAKLLRKNPSGIKRELDKLEAAGIVQSEKVANLKYFCANRDAELFSELKNLITKSLGLPGALKAMLRAAGVTAALIFGPYADGEETDTVDLLVIGGESSLGKGLRDLEKKFGFKIEYTQFDDEEYAQKKKKKDATLKKILSGKTIKLVGRV